MSDEFKEARKCLNQKLLAIQSKNQQNLVKAWVRGGEDMEETKDVLAVVGDQNYANLIMRDGEIKTEPVWNIQQRNEGDE